jgi:hypothetical protein
VSSDDSDDEAPPIVNITVNCFADATAPGGVKCKVTHDPVDTDEDMIHEIERARDDDGEGDEIEVENTKRKPKSKPKKRVNDDDDEKDHDSSDEEDDYCEGDDCDNEDDGETEILECVQKSTMKRR